MKNLGKTAVIGGGSWATAIVKLLAYNASPVYWWMRDKEAVEHLREHHHNPRYLSSVEFREEELEVSTDLNGLLEKVDTIVLAVPAAFLKEALQTADPENFKGKIVFSAVKGIIPEDHLIIGEFMFREYGVKEKDFGVICGPCHAEEVAMEKLSYLTIACQDREKARLFGQQLQTRFIKIIHSEDIYGTEYAAVLKNVVALATGICHGIGYGDNFIAVLLSNAIREIERFVDAAHPLDRDIKDSAYLGDLLVTAYSQFSRNRMFGNMIGRGYSVKAAQFEMNMIAEGYYATRSIQKINEQYQVEMPITQAVYNILYEKISPTVEIRILADKLS